MSKAILVIDMPESCSKCRLKRSWFNYKKKMMVGCRLKGDCGIDWKEKERPNWCPLKTLPSKIIRAFDINESFVDGYNHCLDEILGGNDD